ncbi:hypothetical protein [Halalkalibacter okhensis]|uniref:Uncharacterized protein n=1 Tax=Halalkalibacter okhensis TaxID=333138 RepID=A0A0B0IFU3_9BACI|nr:hypothetical protein [Halalkalibacter okhensis]KHF40180.1 hypothetical protein LQ50_10555 [Halalkalibacter okhensis]
MKRRNEEKSSFTKRMVGEEDETVKKLVKNIKVNPSEESKEKIFQRTMVELEYTRKKHTRIQRFARIFKSMGALTSIGIAAILLISFIVHDTNLDPTVVEFEHGEEMNAGDENLVLPEDQASSSEEKRNIDDYGESRRQEYKDIITYPEGMERVASYQLLDSNLLPFSTYYPADWEEESMVKNGVRGIRLSPPQGPMNQIEIVFFPKDTTSDEVIQEFDRIVLNELGEETEEESQEELAQWAITSTIFRGDMIGTITLGHANDFYFYIKNQHEPEWGDGWYPIKQVLLDEWQWKDNGRTLE